MNIRELFLKQNLTSQFLVLNLPNKCGNDFVSIKYSKSANLHGVRFTWNSNNKSIRNILTITCNIDVPLTAVIMKIPQLQGPIEKLHAITDDTNGRFEENNQVMFKKNTKLLRKLCEKSTFDSDLNWNNYTIFFTKKNPCGIRKFYQKNNIQSETKSYENNQWVTHDKNTISANFDWTSELDFTNKRQDWLGYIQGWLYGTW